MNSAVMTTTYKCVQSVFGGEQRFTDAHAAVSAVSCNERNTKQHAAESERSKTAVFGANMYTYTKLAQQMLNEAKTESFLKSPTA